MAYGSTACLCFGERFGIGVTNTLVRNVHSLYQSVGHTPFVLSPRLLFFAFPNATYVFGLQVDPDAPLYRPTYARHTPLKCISTRPCSSRLLLHPGQPPIQISASLRCLAKQAVRFNRPLTPPAPQRPHGGPFCPPACCRSPSCLLRGQPLNLLPDLWFLFQEFFCRKHHL